MMIRETMIEKVVVIIVADESKFQVLRNNAMEPS